MSVSTLPGYLAKEKRLLYVGDSADITKATIPGLPENYLLISCTSFKEIAKSLSHRSRMPEAIVIDLDLVPFFRLLPLLDRLLANEQYKILPIIGLKGDFSAAEKKQIRAIGFDDCFCKLTDWDVIRKRVDFLNKFKQKLFAHGTNASRDEPFEIPTSKRIFDIVVATSALLFLSPLFVLVAIWIKLESGGPIFYTSKRVGTGYQTFNFIKFRSMFVGSDASLLALAHHNSYEVNLSDNNKSPTFFKIKSDPRVTNVGRFIRKTSIDELPQLINVLRGEMSIVGNRPLPLYEASKLTCDDWAKRFLAPAGLTGLWQVDRRGKDNIGAEERIRLDMNYADNYSFWMDFKIILRTLPAMKQNGE